MFKFRDDFADGPLVEKITWVRVPIRKWTIVKRGHEYSIGINCPDCNRYSELDHDIKDNGDIEPSVVCPYDGCGFHRFAYLVGWDPSA